MGLPPGWQAAQEALQRRQMTHDPFTLPQSVSATRDYLGRVVAGDVFMDSLRHYDNLMARSVGIDPVTMQRTEPDPAAAMELGMEFLPGPMIPGMTVFHGSPHKFTKFDLSKIGTGEGAQAYGHGLYFAENPRVAGNYRNRFAERGGYTYTPEVQKKYFPAWDALTEKLNDAHRRASDFAGDNAARRKAGTEYDQIADELDILQRRMIKDGGIPSEAFLYEVDIPDDAIARMLDWDAPLSEQPEGVKDALAKAFASETGTSYKMAREQIDANNYDLGINFYRSEARRLGAGEFRDDLASEYLRSIGIPGIKYFDGSSRAAGEGTRNIVLFDDSLAKVLKINDEALK